MRPGAAGCNLRAIMPRGHQLWPRRPDRLAGPRAGPGSGKEMGTHMLDQTTTHTLRAAEAATATYDLVVIGAGIAGLNALHAAAAYLPRGARVLLLDEKDRAGGMWNTAYDYVRLHQPHPMFTVGDMKWTWDKPATYLAGRDEIQAHLAGALGPISDRLALDLRLGHRVLSCEEIDTGAGHRARVAFHPMDDPENLETVEAARAIYASGLDYRVPEPLKLTSEAVLSVTPQDLRAALSARPRAPVYVVGGGKTGMDTILEAWAQDPARPVTLLAGEGTNFMNRTKYAPTGLNRWTSGAPFSGLLRDIARSFDGDNEKAMIDHFRRTHATDPDTPNAGFLFGFQSEEEQARIAAGLTQTLPDYLTDVTDTPAGPQMQLRSGASRPVAPGAIFVNCTGSYFRTGALVEPRPALSPQGTVLNITPRDGFHYHTGVSGFFTTHLLYRDQLRGLGLYTIDYEALFRKSKNAFVGAAAAQAYMFHVTMVQTLPLALLDTCLLDLDRWYPLPRRLWWFLQLKRNAAADLAHCRKVLDRVAERFDIPCKPLAPPEPVS